ncbi:MAG: putative ABC transporter permease [Clostridiales bacterium]|nr:putative ABC transporter permease [Clostridiales bacterium]
MRFYAIDQWILFFMFYCFCGWIWESCYVSVLERRWVNRGFLRGPLLPIYGSGALVILIATIRVKTNLWLVFLLGMIAATVLEYITGVVMEKLFKVRYWDYSKQKLNLNGYICLTSSLAWGGFSVLLVRFVHPPIEWLILKIPQGIAEIIAIALVVLFTIDAVQSIRAALDLREMLTKLTEENEGLRRLAKRAEIIAAFGEEDLHKFRERLEWNKVFRTTVNKEESVLRKTKRKERRTASFTARAAAKLKALQELSETFKNALSDHISEERRTEITEALEKIRTYEARIRTRTEKAYHHAMRILRNNPSASAKDDSEAMEDLRKDSELKK